MSEMVLTHKIGTKKTKLYNTVFLVVSIQNLINAFLVNLECTCALDQCSGFVLSLLTAVPKFAIC